MPGRHITSRLVARYMQARHLGRSQIQSADVADISERTGRDLDHGGRAVRGPRTYRTGSTQMTAFVIRGYHVPFWWPSV
jgi:hypothetical protein